MKRSIKSLFHRLIQSTRSTLIDWSASMMNWAGDRLSDLYDRFDDDIELANATWSARSLFWLNNRASDLFALAYPGSDEEIDQALEACIPAQYLSERQRSAVMAEFPNPCYECSNCQWVGFLHQAADDLCPSCGDDHLYIRDRSQVWVPYREYRALATHFQCRPQLSRGGAS